MSHRCLLFACALAGAFLCPPLCAADKSAVGLTAISLPKGPGSIEGLGESFQPSLNTGTASHRLPVRVPPGVAGFAPKLDLVYDGGGANGVVGYGWSLPVPAVQRRSDHGIPTYNEDVGIARTDSFITEGREELVPLPGGDFFCRNEGGFIRYHWSGDHWTGTRPDGVRMEFGLTAGGRIADAGNPAHVFAWLLERETDLHGNAIVYVYRTFDTPNDANQHYLSEVRYGPGAPPWNAFQSVVFDYEARSDWFEDARAGFPVRTGHRLHAVSTATQGVALPGHASGDVNADGILDLLNRRYDLAYLQYAGADTHWSLLSTVQVTGSDGVSQLPAAGFGYAVCNPPLMLSAVGKLIPGDNEPPVVMDNPLADLVDLDGDGLPDLLKTDEGGGAHRIFRNLGMHGEGENRRITWADPAEVPSEDGGAWGFGLSQAETHLADMDGDGLADLVHKSAVGDVFYFRSQGSLGWSARRAMSEEDTPPPAPFGEPGVRTADLDCDKRMDIIQSVGDGGASDYRIWYNLGDQGYSRPITVAQDDGFSLADSRVQLCEMNGDRVVDIARIEAGGIRLTVGLGYGRFAPAQFIPLQDGPLDDGQLGRARLADINGDGLADLVVERAAPGELWYWLNLGTYALSPVHRITDLPPTVGQNAVVRWADLNGNGTTDLVYADHDASPRITAIDLGELITCGGIPNLLTSISNGIGRVTLIQYAPSTRFALEDEESGHPWSRRLPFPVTVVAATTNLDSLGHAYYSEFRYHDGYYDPVEKQFRGFARAEEVIHGDAAAPTLVRETTFDVGDVFEAMKGRQLRVVEHLEDGRVFHAEDTTWTVPPRVLYSGTNGVEVQYAHLVRKLREVSELGQGTPVRVETGFDYDAYGNATLLAEYGVVDGDNRLAGHDERIHRTTYALNTNQWIVRLPRREEVLDGNLKVISRKDSFYDDDAWAGGNAGVVTRGDLTLQREWIDPSAPAAFIDRVRSRYDAFGNRILQLDALAQVSAGQPQPAAGHFREFGYDPDLRLFVTREVAHPGGASAPLVALATLDCGLGVLVSTTDFNGLRTDYRYDPFARLSGVLRPGDTAAFPSEEYDYAMAVPVAGGGMVNFVERRELDRKPGTPGLGHRDHYVLEREYFDGLGRRLLAKQEAEPAVEGGPSRVVVHDAVLFNARMTVATTLQPYFVDASPGASLDQQLAFEMPDAAGWHGLFSLHGLDSRLDLATAPRIQTAMDALLRFTRVTQPDGSHSETRYEPLWSVESDENDTDPASPAFGTPTRLRTDGLGRLAEVVELTHNDDTGKAGPALHAWSTLYDYDANDQLTRRTDAQGNVLTIDFDGLKRRTHLNDPERGEMFFGYDAASNLATRRDARQQQVLYAYDGVNRLISEDYLDDGASDFSYGRHPEVRYHYDDDIVLNLDQGDGTRATFHNGRGHVTWIEDVTGEEHFDYDDRGRTVATVKRVLHPVTGRLESYRTGYRLDVVGRLLGLAFPDGDEVAFTFNERALVSGIAGVAGVAGEPVVPRIRYAPSGQRTQIDFANGVTTGWRYDARLRVERWTTGPAAGPEPWLDYRHTFDAASNLSEVEDLRSPSQAPDGDPRRNSRRFSYDDLHRLLSVRYSHRVPAAGFTAASGLDYAYDRVGSRLATTGVGAVGTEVFLGTCAYGGAGGTSGRTGRGAADPPGPQALTQLVASGGNAPGVSWSYDANGNVRSNGVQRLTWDFLDRLVRVESAEGTTEFRYDHAGTRVWKQFSPAGGEAEVTLYPNRYFEVRDAQQPVKYVWDSEHRVARVIGTLSAGRSRVQRLRLVAGWNLVSAAVDVAGGWESTPGAELVTGLLRWSPVDLAWSPVAKGAAIPAGTVLWVQATAGGVLGWSGLYHDPPALGPGGGPGFLPGTGLEALPLDALWDGSASIQGWIPGSAQWWQFDPAGIATTGNRPKTLPPGSALFLGGAVPGTALEGRPRDRMHFYVADHVESTTLITDLAGGVVEEVALHPFGEVRHRWSTSDASPDPYLFVHKERDRETGFDNFGARLLSSPAGRFLSVDPVASGVEPPSPEATELFWKHPQMQAAYAYAGNNPLRWVDRMGRDITTPLGSRTQTKQADGSVVVDVKGVKVTVLQDTTSKDVPAGRSATTGPEMKVRVVNGKVSVQLFLQTKYKDGVDPNAKSAYGRGTTDEDKKAGNTSLKFHESQHGVDFLEWLEKNPFPVADGATITREENAKLRDKIKEWKEKYKEYTEKKTDCVGNKEPGCP